MRSTKLRRTLGAFAVAALAATACSGGGGTTEEPTDTGTGTEAPTETGTAAPSGDYDWADVNRRKAVSMAINREEIASVIFNGARAPGDYWWPPTLTGYEGGSCANL